MSKAETYKEWILKSGFPLENDVLQVINQVLPESKVSRDHEFFAKNESGEPNIRSLDFIVTIEKESQNIPVVSWPRSSNEKIEVTLLIDAKYSQDENFLFTPSSAQVLQRTWPSLIPVVKKNRYDEEVCYYREDFLNLTKLQASLPCAGNGRKVKEQSKERDSIASMALQAFQGLSHHLNLKAKTIGTTNAKDSSYTRDAHFYFTIIVTNAPLLLIKPLISSSEVENSTGPENLYTNESALILDMPNIFDLKTEWEALKSAANRTQNKNLGWYEGGLNEGSLLICNLSGLETFLTSLKTAVNQLPLTPPLMYRND